MYHSGKNPLKRVSHHSDSMPTVKGLSQRRLHKAFLRYHDPDNWPMLREALKKMGRADLIGNGNHQLVPTRQPAKHHPVVAADSQPFATQHNGVVRVPARPKRRTRP
jgi:hypothetical protein